MAEEVDLFNIPSTVQGLISARLDRLDEKSREVLRNASLIGWKFFYRVLHRVDDSEGTLDLHLAGLLQQELIEEVRREPELEYAFKHTLVHEAIYDRILLHNRKALHLRVGQAIETEFSDRLEAFYVLIAYHYARAEAWDRGQEYLLKAGDQAGRIAADAEALGYYQRAIDAVGDQWDPLQGATLSRKIAEALFRRGRHGEALANLQQALQCLKLSLPEQAGHMCRAVAARAAAAAPPPPRIMETAARHRSLGSSRGGRNDEDLQDRRRDRHLHEHSPAVLAHPSGTELFRIPRLPLRQSPVIRRIRLCPRCARGLPGRPALSRQSR